MAGREGRSAVLDAREALPHNWTRNGTLDIKQARLRAASVDIHCL